MNKDFKKGLIIGVGITSAVFLSLAGCQWWLINNVPYTYRTSGPVVLINYLLGEGIGACDDGKIAWHRLFK